MCVERVPRYGCKKMAAYRRSLLLVLLRNVSENEEDSCSLGLDEGTDTSSKRPSPVEFDEKSVESNRWLKTKKGREIRDQQQTRITNLFFVAKARTGQ